MAQTPEGAIKIFCERHKLSVEAYYRKLSAGYKWCVGCKKWHLLKEFGSDKSRYDGYSSSCLSFRRKDCKLKYKPKPNISRKGKRFTAARNGDKRQARSWVNHLIEIGSIPSPNELPCIDCGHIYKNGERRHEYHHESYDADKHENVICLCTTCHGKRHSSPERYKKAVATRQKNMLKRYG